MNNINNYFVTNITMSTDTHTEIKINNLAASLQALANIDNSNNLVSILATGNESDNYEALRYWVSIRIIYIDELYSDPLDYLYALLIMELTQRMDTN